ncbi:MAG: diacylglycerol kinase [Flavobacteriales bacterium]|jgi:dihydrofolate reductase|nr:diacylglycerol kinase [Flavobacteriales bacterium]|tara:strand:- start:467 stop:961 length:495 start_codon:yes stop_codon:yes gene_type:complete
MENRELTIIAAVSINNVIGNNNKLIWKLSNDLKRFKNLTTNHSVIMGRKTFESLPNPLPDRDNIVITRDTNYSKPNIQVCSSIEDAINLTKTDTQPFIIGGGEIYSQTINIVDKIELTRVHEEFDGDAYFPEIPLDIFELINEENYNSDLENEFDYSYLTYKKR